MRNMRPIDADWCRKQIQDLRDKLDNGTKHEASMRGGIRKSLAIIECAPTLDVAPVVRCKECKRRFLEICKGKPENYFCADGEKAGKYGTWIYNGHACGYYCPGYLCSECFYPQETRLRECPRCGAKMNLGASK